MPLFSMRSHIAQVPQPMFGYLVTLLVVKRCDVGLEKSILEQNLSHF